jgi:hypothetical protein
VKKTYLLLLIILPCFVQAQRSARKQQRDSVRFYQKELVRLYRENLDTFRRSAAYNEAYGKYLRAAGKRTSYGGISLFMDLYHSDYRQFNTMLAEDGFAPLNDMGYRLGFGFTFKVNHIIIDMNLLAAGFDNKTTKDNEKVSASFTNFISADIGYDLLNNWNISIYPFAGLGWRHSTINYTRNDDANPNYTSITNMISNGEHLILQSSRVGYQLGVGFDLAIFPNRQKTGKAMLFMKAGMNRPLWKDKYQYNDLPQYNADIKQGDRMLTFGFKFVG